MKRNVIVEKNEYINSCKKKKQIFTQNQHNCWIKNSVEGALASKKHTTITKQLIIKICMLHLCYAIAAAKKKPRHTNAHSCFFLFRQMIKVIQSCKTDIAVRRRHRHIDMTMFVRHARNGSNIAQWSIRFDWIDSMLYLMRCITAET